MPRGVTENRHDDDKTEEQRRKTEQGEGNDGGGPQQQGGGVGAEGVQAGQHRRHHIEVAIRAFDPCLSCSTHALGKMPLEVVLQDQAGRTIDRIVKSGAGA